MAWFQKPGCKVGKMKPNKSKFFRQGDLISLLGTKPVFIPLKWDDVIVAREDWQDESLGKNEIASILLNKPVYGPALIAEPQELEP
jgi:hypothetical protein